MTKPKNRSNSVRKLFKRVPSGKTVIKYKKRKKTKHHYDGSTRELLQGVSNDPTLPKSARTVSRRYGGFMSQKRVETVMRYATLVEQGEMTLNQIPFEIRKYVKIEVERLIKKK